MKLPKLLSAALAAAFLAYSVTVYAARVDINGHIDSDELEAVKAAYAIDGTVWMVIASNGGESEAMLNIIDFLNSIGNANVTAAVSDHAHSAASAIFLAADTRLVHRAALLGYHRGRVTVAGRTWTCKTIRYYLDTGKLHPEQIRAEGNFLDDKDRNDVKNASELLREEEKYLASADQRLINFMASRIGKSALEVESLYFRDHGLVVVTGEQAVEAGIATGFVSNPAPFTWAQTKRFLKEQGLTLVRTGE